MGQIIASKGDNSNTLATPVLTRTKRGLGGGLRWVQLGRVCASVYVVSQGKTRERGSNKRVVVVLAKQVKSIQKIS